MTEFETASLILRGLVGAGQIVVVAIGIMVMRGMNKDRTRQFEAQMEAQRHEAEARRAEAERREKREDEARRAEAERREQREAERRAEAERREKREAEARRAEAERREQREDERRAEAERREQRENARHAEAMRALDATIQRLEQQGE